jgi:predicted ATPase
MSYLEGLALLGVRSFSPDEPSYLKFFSPVTVIVGPNGSGKTVKLRSLHNKQVTDNTLYRPSLKV